jgi:DNA-binding transcriptional regulator GbsR (MarR family)
MDPRDPSAEQRVADAIGRMMAFWGFRRNLGRIWALLYLAPAPVAAAELVERLRLSTGAVSMALSE